MDRSASRVMKRIGLAVLGRMLPETSALSGMVHDVRRGLLATVVTGVLVSALLLLGCIGLYQWLLSEGMASHIAISLSAVFLLMLSVISALVADRFLSKVDDVKEKLSTSSHSELGQDIEAIITAFADGFSHPDTNHSTPDDSESPAAPPASTENGYDQHTTPH